MKTILILTILLTFILFTSQQSVTISPNSYSRFPFSTSYVSINYYVSLSSGSNVNVYLFDFTNYNNYVNYGIVGSTLQSYLKLSYPNNSMVNGTYGVASDISNGVTLVVENKGTQSAFVNVVTGGIFGNYSLGALVLFYYIFFIILGILCLPCIIVGVILLAISPFLPIIIIVVLVILVLRQNHRSAGEFIQI